LDYAKARKKPCWKVAVTDNRPAEQVPEHFWNIGIRIEDDVLITEHGNEVLTQAAVKTVDAIESQMAAGR